MATDISDIVKQGYLRIRSCKLGLWQRRWLVLRRASSKAPCRLEKYADERAARGVVGHKIALLTAVSSVARVHDKRHAFTICFMDHTTKCFAADSDIELPEHRKLTVIPKVPQYYVNNKPPLMRRLHSDIRGPELVHNQLLHKQYGIIALSGGYLTYGTIEVIRNTVNREMDTRKTFAMWRIDPLWKPVSKKSIGKRMGGGKGSVHHYATPVKAGRIIIEVGGKVEFEEVYPFLNRVAIKMPFDALVVSQTMLEDLEKEANDMHKKNINPFSFKHSVDNDMQGCNLWNSPRDKIYYDEYI